MRLIIAAQGREVRVAALEMRMKFKIELIWNEKKQASLSGEQDSQVRGERPPCLGHSRPLVRGKG